MVSLRYAAAPRELAIGRTAVLPYGSAVHTPHRSALVCHSLIHEQDLDVVLLHTPRRPRSVMVSLRYAAAPRERPIGRTAVLPYGPLYETRYHLVLLHVVILENLR
jgi:hypothetical protein